jgi:molybdate/tungstate transport system ATP-binding protein
MKELVLENIRKRIGGNFGLNVNLIVRTGDYFVLLGPCGSGKTKLLETVAGILPPDSGRVLLDGHDVTGLAPEKRNMGFVYQNKALFPHMSVRDNIEFGLLCRPLSRVEREHRMERVSEALGIASLMDRRDSTSLSGGEAQKVAMARALVLEPSLLLLDEPLSSMDPGAREAFYVLLSKLPGEFGLTVIHVTHDLTEARALGKSMGVMRDGRVEQTGTVEEMMTRPATRYVADFLMVQNLVPLRALGITSPFETGCFRPEEVHLLPIEGSSEAIAEGFGQSDHFHFSCRIVAVHDRGDTVRVDLAAPGLDITASLGKAVLRRGGFSPGDSVVAVIMRDSVHTI